VVFGEEYQFELPHTLQQCGIRTASWMDAYIAKSWRPLLKFYDALWCLTHRAETILLDWKKGDQTHYIGWGVPQELFASQTQESSRFDFMHSAGWLGLDMRKGTDTLLSALDLMSDDSPEVLLHCQVPEAEAKRALGYEAWPPHVIYEDRDVPPPGLYHAGRVVVQPSKVEGFGLSIVEALCAGKPIITVNAPPMNEFVRDRWAWLVDPEGWKPHVDGSVYEQAVISPGALAKVMREAQATSDERIADYGERARLWAKHLFNWGVFTTNICEGLNRIGIGG
jgi:1,2-diacylglycerol 3-alpha-glucosyltransferase